MRREHVSALALSLVLLFTAGCAPKQPELTRSKIYQKFESVGALDAALDDAEQDEVHIFAPDGFEQTKDIFDEAFAFAKDGKQQEAMASAGKGQNALIKAEADAEQAKEIMREVVAHRDLAIEAKAPELFSDEFTSIEKELKKANSLIESGDLEKAKEYRPELLNDYDEIQIEALEKGLMELAKSSSARARENDAENYAPKTMIAADKELELAISIIKTDRTNMEVANDHARNADYTYRKANRITDTIKKSERRDRTEEDVILTNWGYLGEINAPTGTTLDLTVREHLLIASIRRRVEALGTSLEDSNMLVGKLEDRITRLQADHKAEIDKLESSTRMQLTVLQKKQAEAERHQRELKERQAFISSLFTSKEATVYRKGEDILISANGFYFKVGKAEIETANFGLLNKILSSIKQFPGSVIRISGHTDSTGGSKANLLLSRKRAENVAKFLINIGSIDPARIAFAGYGESKPVANNKTADGRAKNRRIDLMIVNKKK